MDDLAFSSKIGGYAVDHLLIGKNFSAAQVVRLVKRFRIIDCIEAG